MQELLELNNRYRDGNDEVWVKHYSSNHQILLVGEGDFSFSHSLATSFPTASNICASSLDSYDDVVRKYKKARSNLQFLKRHGAFLLHGVDATKLQLHPDLNCRRFDRIIFNFPHAGFHGKESDSYLIRKHKELVFGFFHGASHMLRANGEIHVTNKNKAPYCHWNLEELASKCCLVLFQCVSFKKRDYIGYENKRGDGSRCDQPFLLGDCTTFKFRCPQAFSNKHLVYPHFTQAQGLSYYLQDPLVQSRQRTSPPLALSYYHEHICSQLEVASIREAQRQVPFGLQRNHALFQERSRFQFEASHHRQEQYYLECSRLVNGVLSHENYSPERQRMFTRTSFPCSYTKESQERRRSLLYRDFELQGNQESSPGRSRFAHGVYKRKVEKMLIRRRVPHPYTREGSMSRRQNQPQNH